MNKQLFQVRKLATAVVATLAMASGSAMAAVSAEEAARLGADLTPIGAEKAGNADGSIPAWNGGMTESVTQGENPFADEQPLYVITNANKDQYKDLLTPGQIALFERYPETYRMPVYQSRRTAAYPEVIYEKAKENATKAVIREQVAFDYDESVPFAIPQNAEEVVWNHLLRYRGGSVKRDLMQAAVQRNGDYTPVKLADEFVFPWHIADGYDPEKDSNVLFYFKQVIKAPARLTGTVLLVHETLDQIKQPRLAWIYNAGQRRVRRAPQIAYDGPGTASDGLRTSDNFDMFNGAIDKYDWKLVGKKELLIPYNSFKLADKSLKYDDILMAGHINPEFTRYEKHRVWVVEATLSEGERHIYGKRVFYIDEDTWGIAVADHYDGRGELWRVSEGHEIQYTEAKVPWNTAEIIHDLQSGRYLALGLTNEEKGLDFDHKAKHRDFTPSALRRAAKR
ncbi:DUF1329 domain-containing protein [Motiliproteus coralliicola]|uniref:DUF1329 domain-containing protein n=1 Tax=Motiliproteus coralliicola TaxID=2283196 RepID=A0A369WTJ8_9GAMM|nr:DUF1329 domain-containing protein [Motiliproteus coralliicola]RDE24997.1 DUF1329 domain-containing protein [Motiliproteus coralliicola]